MHHGVYAYGQFLGLKGFFNFNSYKILFYDCLGPQVLSILALIEILFMTVSLGVGGVRRVVRLVLKY